MSDVTQFRGFGGEAVVQLVRPGTWFTALPVLALYGITGLILEGAGGAKNPLVSLLVWLLVSGYLVGRFAIPAASGEGHLGFISKLDYHVAARWFAIRYLIVTFIWALPCAGLLWLASKTASPELWAGMMMWDMRALGYGGGLVLLVIAALIIAVVGPTAGLIICTLTDSVEELFYPENWRYVGARAADVIAFYGYLVGGLFVFWLIYGIPLLVIGIMASSISSSLAGSIFTFAWFLPAGLWPILTGRLCGYFVFYDSPAVAPSHTPYSTLLGANDAEVAGQAAEKIAQKVKPEGAAQEKESVSPSQSSSPSGSSPSRQTSTSHQTRPASTVSSADKTTAEKVDPDSAPMAQGPVLPEAIKAKVAGLSDVQAENRGRHLTESFPSCESLPDLFEYQLLMLRLNNEAQAVKAVIKLILLATEGNGEGHSELISAAFLAMEEKRFELALVDSDWYRVHEALLETNNFVDSAQAAVRSLRGSHHQSELMERLEVIRLRAEEAGELAQAEQVRNLISG